MKHLKPLAILLGMALSTTALDAQIAGCNNPVNMVTNGNFNAALTVTQTNYALAGLGDDCLENQYVLGTDFQNKCTGWNSITGDGNFMIVDNGTTTGTFMVWRQTISGIQSNTNYTFAIDKNDYYNDTEGLIIIINGTTVSTNFANPTTPQQWLTTGNTLPWNSGPGAPSSIDIEIRVNRNARNDFAVDNIFFGTCGDCEANARFSYSQDPETCGYTFNSTSTVGNPNTTIIGYLWDFGDGTTSNLANPVHTYQSTGVYLACLTIMSVNQQGECCTDVYCEEIVNECEAGPCVFAGNFNVSQGNNSCAFTFTSAITSSSPIIAYVWDFGDGNMSTDPNPTHQYASGGGYQVCVTVYGLNGNECCSKIFCKEIEVSECGKRSFVTASTSSTSKGISATNSNQQQALKVYPNPNSGELNVELDTDLKDTFVDISVFDATGRLVLEQRAENNNGLLRLNTQALETGVHIIKLKTNSAVYSKLFMME